MELNIAYVIGAVLAIVIVCVFVDRTFKALSASGWNVHPAIPIVVWGLVIIVSIFLIAWAFGIVIPFVKLI